MAEGTAPVKAIPLLLICLTLFVSCILETASDSGCLGERSQGTGTCYSYRNTVVTWSEARHLCRDQGGQLAAFLQYSDQDVLRYLLPGGATPAGTTAAWIGAYHTKSEWTWIETGEVLSPQGCFTDRRESDERDLERLVPVTNLTPARCIEACRSITYPKTYRYAGVQGGNQCYCGNSTYGRYGTNSECTIKCPNGNFYCGGSLMNFVYKIGGAYGLWAYAQPNNYGGDQNCGVIDITQNVKMADESCFTGHAYMCEIDGASMSRCQSSRSDYFYFDRSSARCFYINETKVSWETARRACLALASPGPGHLLTIDSPETHDVVRNITTRAVPVASKIWIGLSKGPGWQWVTGAPFNFSFWAPASEVPGNPISVNTCGTVNVTVNNAWTDTNCDAHLPYICQSDDGGNQPVPTKTTPSSGASTTPGTESLAPPSSGQSKASGSQLSTVELVIAILMPLFGLILLILAIYCLAMLVCHRRNKIWSYDARPKAPIPNSGMTSIQEYDKYSYADSTTELYRS